MKEKSIDFTNLAYDIPELHSVYVEYLSYKSVQEPSPIIPTKSA